jgi:membrane protein
MTKSKESRRAWTTTLKHTGREVKQDNLTIVAAGVAFFAFLAIFPALAALISIYGLVADPAAVEQQVASLRGVLPAQAADLIGSQLQRIASGSSQTLGWSLALSVVLGLWSANKGMKGLVQGLNIAYGEEDRRPWIKRTAIQLMLTLGAIIAAILAIGMVVALPAVLSFLGLGGGVRIGVEVARWVLLAALVVVGLGIVYRLGPARGALRPRRWITPGAVVATVLWLIGSVLFSIYVANFGSYAKTYGALAAVVILLIWFYLTAFVILLGAELDGEREKTRRTMSAGEAPA